MIRENSRIGMQGHILITDMDSGKVVLDVMNAVHKENMAAAIASAMTNSVDSDGKEGFVNKLCFGDGGSESTSDGRMIYGKTNSTGHAAGLHSAIYQKIVDYRPIPGNDTTHTRISHVPGTDSAAIRIICVLDNDEPEVGSTGRNSGTDFVFDEMGVVSQQGHLLTHATFHPIRKGVDNRLRIEYSLNMILT